jgi:2-methylisocitrate lyase-like PEP mutase family enzyme
MTLTDTFRALHTEGLFVMPNPWDRGSARILQEVGFRALATTSAGFARSIGKNDQQVTRDELVAHVAELTSVLDIPLNVDSERLFPDDAGGITETVRLLAEAGAAGCSIEDFRPSTRSIVTVAEAAEAVAEAAAACAAHGVVLTARCENLLYGAGDLDDTIARLVAYREAGAEVLYPPGLVEAADITRVVTEVGAPVNVLAFPGSPPIDQLAGLGVRRVSTGGALQTNAYKAMRHDAEALLALQPD